MARTQKEPTAEFNPGYGCFIMLAAIIIFGGIISWSAYTLFEQNRLLDTITVDQAVTWPEIRASDTTALNARLSDFGKAAMENREATLDLTIEEINTLIAIAPDTGYGSYAKLVRVKRADPASKTLIADVSLPIKRLKFWEPPRYLNGEAGYTIDIIKGEGPDAKLTSLTVPGKTVPDGVVDNMQIWPWVAPYRKIDSLAPTLRAIQHIEVTTTGLQLRSIAPAPSK
ncbi:MAG: hypothetical protein KDK97_00405 [Verrucomicrobiales bacterium]|nr:hypothetical protein [Verrucomicrobiales bacterium]